MTEQLFLRMGRTPDRVDVVVLTPEGRQVRPPVQLSLAGVASLAEGRRVSILVASDQAVVTSAQIPRASAARMRSLLPFSLEDHFATEIDELHFAAGPALPDGRILATVVEKSQMDAWLDQLSGADIRPHAIYADCDGVANIPSTLVLVAEDDSVLGRLPDQAAFKLEGLALDEIWSLLTSAGEDSSRPRHVLIYGRGTALSARANEIEKLRAMAADLDVREVRDSTASLLAATVLGSGGTNLLQGEYARRSNLRAGLRPWYRAAAIAAALGCVSLLGAGIDLLRLQQADATLTRETESICTNRFGVSLASACRAEVQRRLASAGQSPASTQESFLSALSTVAEADGPDRIEALSYRNRTLDMDMQVADVSALDQFARQVSGTNRFEVRTLSNTPQDDGLRSRVQIVVAQ